MRYRVAGTWNSTRTPGTVFVEATTPDQARVAAAHLQLDPMKVTAPSFKAHKNVEGDPEKIRLSNSPLSARRQVDTLASKLRDPRFDFMFKPGDWLPSLDGAVTADLDRLIASWVGGAKPISVLDLSGIPSVVLKDLIGAVLRILYSAMFWARHRSEGGRERPLLLVLEEAHTYLGENQSGVAADAIKRVAKEGRKYGVGLMLVSQRPSEIDSTILSQCGTLIAMRLANDRDRGHVTGAASENLKGLFDMLPVLRTGEAIIVGEAVSLPIRTLIDRLPPEQRPDSEDPRVVDRRQTDYESGIPIEGIPEGPGGWDRRREKEDYAGVLEQMRLQDPHYRHAKKATGSRCDLFVLIVAYRFGWIPRTEDGGNGEKSVTQMEYEFWKLRERLCGQWPAIVLMASNDDRFLSDNETDELRARQVLFRASVGRETAVHPFRFLPLGDPGHGEAVREFTMTLRDQLVQAKDRMAEQTRVQALRAQAEAQKHVKAMQQHVEHLQQQLVVAQAELKSMRDHQPGNALALLTVGGLIGVGLTKGQHE